MKKRLILASVLLVAVLLGVLAYSILADARPRIGMTEEEVEQVMGPPIDPPMREIAIKPPVWANAWRTKTGAFYVEFQAGRVSAVRFVADNPGFWDRVRKWVGW
jgi:hypothetical protein